MPTVHVKRQVSLQIAADSFFKKLHWKNTDEVVAYSSMDHYGGRARDIAASGSIPVDLGGITTIKSVYVEADAALDVTLNGNTTQIAPPDTGGVAVFYAEGAFTSLTLTNPSSLAAVEVTYQIVGN